MHALASIDIGKLPRDVDVLLGLIEQLHTQYGAILGSLAQQLQSLRRLHFGAKSERLPGQAELFSEVLHVPAPPLDQIEVKYKRARRGRPALPKDLPRERIDYDLSEAEKAQFDSIERIGEEISETLEYTPAMLKVIEHARAKYVCRRHGESTMRTAAASPSPLPKSNAGASLLAQILVSTFADHLPLNRQERIYRRHGAELPRSTLCEYKLSAGELLAALRPALIAHVLAAPRVHADDTTFPLIEGGRGQTKTARMWGYLGAGARRDAHGRWVEHPPAVVFEFTDSRESAHPVRFLKGYRGYLQADAYSGFEALYRGGEILPVGCWAHCRRRFFEIAKTHKPPGLAAEALAWIGELYRIESAIRGRRIRSTKRARAKRSPCSESSGAGSRVTSRACCRNRPWAKRSAMRCATGQRSPAIPRTVCCCPTTIFSSRRSGPSPWAGKRICSQPPSAAGTSLPRFTRCWAPVG